MINDISGSVCIWYEIETPQWRGGVLAVYVQSTIINIFLVLDVSGTAMGCVLVVA